jgi:phage-related protein (TIGR01555 family)
MFWKKKIEEPKAKRAERYTEKVKLLDTNFEQANGVATKDSASQTIKRNFNGGANIKQANYYINRGFIGYNLMSHIALHWLCDKACSMPARDVIRHGYIIQEDDADLRKQIETFDNKTKLNKKLKDFITMGRVFGGALALFDVRSDNPIEYYENPFNIDGVKDGSYKGIRLIDPSNASPILTNDNIQDPTSESYNEPTYWLIGGRKYHHSHFVKYVPFEVTSIAKHRYNYFGISVPERIYHRLYAAETVADEAPKLTVSKRLVHMGLEDYNNTEQEIVQENMEYFTQHRDNYGVLITDKTTVLQQHETNLADLDITIMTQYQLVAASAEIPAVKLLETTPKGFNATGEFEAESYRENLESIQTNDLDPLLERHYNLVAKSLELANVPEWQWNSLNSPTANEYADLEFKKMQTHEVARNVGAVDAYDIRNIISQDKEGYYFGVVNDDEELSDDETI